MSRIERSSDIILLLATTHRRSGTVPRTEAALMISLSSLLVPTIFTLLTTAQEMTQATADSKNICSTMLKDTLKDLSLCKKCRRLWAFFIERFELVV